MSRRTLFPVFCITVATTLITAACAAGSTAVSVRSGNSRATIEQRGGHYPSQSRIYRMDGGHAIIAQDGRSTDITVQGEWPMAPPPTHQYKPCNSAASCEYFERPDMRQRFESPFAQ